MNCRLRPNRGQRFLPMVGRGMSLKKLVARYVLITMRQVGKMNTW